MPLRRIATWRCVSRLPVAHGASKPCHQTWSLLEPGRRPGAGVRCVHSGLGEETGREADYSSPNSYINLRLTSMAIGLTGPSTRAESVRWPCLVSLRLKSRPRFRGPSGEPSQRCAYSLPGTLAQKKTLAGLFLRMFRTLYQRAHHVCQPRANLPAAYNTKEPLYEHGGLQNV